MSSKAFTARTFAFLHQVNRNRRLTAIDLSVCMELTKYFAEKDHNGRAWPSCKTIGDAINVHETTVIRSVRRVAAQGHLQVVWGRQGAGHPNQYWMIVKPAPAQVSGAEKPARKKPAPAQKKPAPAQENLLKNHCGGNATHSPPLGERHEPSVRDSSGSGRALEGPPEPLEESEIHLEAEPGGTSPRVYRREDDPAAMQINGRKSPGVNQPIQSPEISGLRPPAEDGVHAAWRELRELWAVRPWPVTPREMAIGWALFVKLIAAGVPIDVILAGAGAWVRGIDEPRYLPALPQWLAARAWEQPPPAKRKRSNKSSVRRDQLPRQNGKVDLSTLTLKRAGYVEDENGNLYHPDGNAGSAFWWRASS